MKTYEITISINVQAGDGQQADEHAADICDYIEGRFFDYYASASVEKTEEV